MKPMLRTSLVAFALLATQTSLVGAASAAPAELVADRAVQQGAPAKETRPVPAACSKSNNLLSDLCTTDQAEIVDTLMTLDGEVLSTQVYDESTMDQILGEDTNASTEGTGGLFATAAYTDGGTSSASGCREVTVTNIKKNLSVLATMFKFETATRWCWHRASKEVFNVSTNHRVSNVNGFVNWHGIIGKTTKYYDAGANDGYPRSAYKHWKQAKASNEAPVLGTLGYIYPENTLLSYWNGTYKWSTKN